MMFLKLLFAALLALGTENLLFAGGIGFSRALRAARRPVSAGLFAGFVTLFSLASALLPAKLLPFLPDFFRTAPMIPVVVAVLDAVCYLLAAGILRVVHLYDRCGPFLVPAAVNTLVLAMPFLRDSLAFSAVQAAGFAVGTGAAFFLAALVLAHAMELCRNPDIPLAFRGLPATLLYVGILSMAFAGFTGGRIF